MKKVISYLTLSLPLTSALATSLVPTIANACSCEDGSNLPEISDNAVLPPQPAIPLGTQESSAIIIDTEGNLVASQTRSVAGAWSISPRSPLPVGEYQILIGDEGSETERLLSFSVAANAAEYAAKLDTPAVLERTTRQGPPVESCDRNISHDAFDFAGEEQLVVVLGDDPGDDIDSIGQLAPSVIFDITWDSSAWVGIRECGSFPVEGGDDPYVLKSTVHFAHITDEGWLSDWVSMPIAVLKENLATNHHEVVHNDPFIPSPVWPLPDDYDADDYSTTDDTWDGIYENTGSTFSEVVSESNTITDDDSLDDSLNDETEIQYETDNEVAAVVTTADPTDDSQTQSESEVNLQDDSTPPAKRSGCNMVASVGGNPLSSLPLLTALFGLVSAARRRRNNAPNG